MSIRRSRRARPAERDAHRIATSGPPATPFAARVADAVRAIPPGRAVSYGMAADRAGAPGAARQVGRALAALSEEAALGADPVPWWRVVNAGRRISLPPHLHGDRLQRALLEDEGVRFDDAGRVGEEHFGWG